MTFINNRPFDRSYSLYYCYILSKTTILNQTRCQLISNLIIEEGKQSPAVELKEGILTFHGRAIIEDPKTFFEPVFEWIKEYMKNPASTTMVDIRFEYIDMPATQSLFKILTKLGQLNRNGHELKINWYYEYGDIEMVELGEVIQGRLDISFDFKETRFAL